MPLNVARVVDGIKADMEAKGFKFDELAFTKDFLNSVVSRIVTEIQVNAVVSGPVTVTSVAGVTVGAGVSGPGAGTLSAGTIA